MYGDSCGLGTHGQFEWCNGEVGEDKEDTWAMIRVSYEAGYLPIHFNCKYKPLPRKLCTDPQSKCVR